MSGMQTERLKWEIAKVLWGHVARYLDDGWEPFAVVQRQPNTPSYTTEEVVYLRREKADAG